MVFLAGRAGGGKIEGVVSGNRGGRAGGGRAGGRGEGRWEGGGHGFRFGKFGLSMFLRGWYLEKSNEKD